MALLSREGNTTIKTNMQYYQDQQQYIVNRTLDDTKDSIKRVADATSKEISRYNQANKDFQEETIKQIGEIMYNYIDTQKEIAETIQSASSSYEGTKMFPAWGGTGNGIEKMISNFVDNIITTSSAFHSTVRTYLDASNKLTMQMTKDSIKGASKITTNIAKTYHEMTAIATAAG